MAAPAASFKPFAVVIKNHYCPTYSLRVMIDSDTMTIGKLKTEIEKQHKGHPQVQDQLLVHRGRLLESKLNLSKLFQSSIINPIPNNTGIDNNNNNNNDQHIISTMYIHMTLRGGSNTATKIGLNATDTRSSSSSPLSTNTAKPSTNINKTSTASTQPTVSETETEEKQAQIHTSSIPPHPPHPPHPMHPPPLYPPYAHYYPPPNAHYFSQSMPNLMHPMYLQRTHSAPSKPSHAFHPPTLVQQTSNPNMHSSQPQYAHYPPYPPPLHPMHYPHPHYAPYGHPPPFPHHSHSMSDLNVVREQFVSKKEKKEEKEEKKGNDNNDNDDGNNNNNNNIGAYGLRRRRVNNDNDRNAAAVNRGNNANMENGQRERWFVRLFRALNINVLIRLSIFMWFFGPNLGTYRFTMLFIIGALYYLYQVGLLQRLFGNWNIGGNRNRNRNNNEVRHRDPNNDSVDGDNEEFIPPTPPLSCVQLLQRFLIGIVASLWPTWDPATLYPVPQ